MTISALNEDLIGLRVWILSLVNVSLVIVGSLPRGISSMISRGQTINQLYQELSLLLVLFVLQAILGTVNLKTCVLLLIKHLCIESTDDEQKYLSDFISKMERGIPLTTNMTDEMFCDLRNIPREKCINQIKIRMSYKHNRINLYNYDLLKLQMTY